MGKVVERIVNAERVEDLITVFGSFDENIKRIEEALNVRVVNRGTDLRVSGDEEMADKAVRTLEGLLSLAAKGETIDEQRVRYLITLVNEGNDAQVAQMAKDVVCITAKGKPIKAKTVGQQNYMKAIMKNTITIGVGPAGTGKTMLRYYCLAVPQMLLQILLTDGAYVLFHIKPTGVLHTLIYVVVMILLYIIGYMIQQRWVFAPQKQNEPEVEKK